MASKSKSKQQEALQLLDDLDSFTPVDAGPADAASNSPSAAPPSSASPSAQAPTAGGNGEAAEVLAFLDEITQKSAEPSSRPSSTVHISRSGTPTVRKSTERVKLGGGTPSSLLPGASASSTSLHRQLSSSSASASAVDSGAKVNEQPAASSSSGGGGASWGWGSVWSTASAAIQQAKSAVDEQVKHLPQVQIPKNEQARKWGEGVLEYARNTQLDKLGQDFRRVGLSTLNDILNVVAPPISEHEVIHVWLSHDMQGYDGIESLTYRALARIMEQVDGGDLIVNRGNESKPKDGSGQREMNVVDGYEAAVRLSQADLEELIKSNGKTNQPQPSSVTTPTTHSHVYLRIQPFFTTYSVPPVDSGPASSNQQLSFLLHLTDPEHQLVQSTITQSVPSQWLALWDEYDWVEDLVAEALRVGVEVVGQEYIVARMGWTGMNKAKAKEEEGDIVSNDSEEKKEQQPAS